MSDGWRVVDLRFEVLQGILAQQMTPFPFGMKGGI
jgi:hypothetical protein